MSLGRGERCRARRHERLDEPGLHARRYDGEPFEAFQRGRVEMRHPGLDGVRDRHGHRRRVAGGQDLGDEVRVAGGYRENLVGIDVRADVCGGAQPAYRGRAEPGQAQPSDRSHPRGQPEQLP